MKVVTGERFIGVTLQAPSLTDHIWIIVQLRGDADVS